ncbi:hypothetical protein ACIA8C_40080 [Nocardia sp. NPDC051321]|uniref:hypothetical protein n=1 Tax=Nocardia sp. NPDC051321 TaxID=3364323 RepID=UPI0037AAECE5
MIEGIVQGNRELIGARQGLDIGELPGRSGGNPVVLGGVRGEVDGYAGAGVAQARGDHARLAGNQGEFVRADGDVALVFTRRIETACHRLPGLSGGPIEGGPHVDEVDLEAAEMIGGGGQRLRRRVPIRQQQIGFRPVATLLDRDHRTDRIGEFAV